MSSKIRNLLRSKLDYSGLLRVTVFSFAASGLFFALPFISSSLSGGINIYAPHPFSSPREHPLYMGIIFIAIAGIQYFLAAKLPKDLYGTWIRIGAIITCVVGLFLAAQGAYLTNEERKKMMLMPCCTEELVANDPMFPLTHCQGVGCFNGGNQICKTCEGMPMDKLRRAVRDLKPQ